MSKKRDRFASLLRRLSRMVDAGGFLASEKSPSSLASLSSKELRTSFLSELKLLEEKLSDVGTAFQKELAELRKALDRASDGELYASMDRITDSLTKIRRSLFRTSLSLQSDRELQTEWNEWRRLAAQSEHDPIRTHVQRERLEMLGSERDLRRAQERQETGFRAPEGSRVPTAAEEPKEIVIEAIQTRTQWIPTMPPKERELSDWDEMYESAVLEHVRYWELVLSQLESPAVFDPQDLVSFYRSLRQAHGELRLLDRARGHRRFRLNLFEASTH